MGRLFREWQSEKINRPQAGGYNPERGGQV